MITQLVFGLVGITAFVVVWCWFWLAWADDWTRGNDGLTDWQRKRLARRYRKTVMKPLTPAERAAIRAFLEQKRAERREQP